MVPGGMFFRALNKSASRNTSPWQKDSMNNDLQSAEFRERWAYIAEPGWEINQEVFSRADRRRAKVLHCAIPVTQAKRLTDAVFPTGWDIDKCLIASVGRKARPELENWEYSPQIGAVPQLPYQRSPGTWPESCANL